MAVLIVMLVLYGIFSKKGDEQSHIWNAALVIFFPFVIVSLISLSMLLPRSTEIISCFCILC